jgi:hypothetical protein
VLISFKLDGFASERAVWFSPTPVFELDGHSPALLLLESVSWFPESGAAMFEESVCGRLGGVLESRSAESDDFSVGRLAASAGFPSLFSVKSEPKSKPDSSPASLEG